MSRKPPAEQIENPGRKPSWSQERMEEAIDRYFEVGNFNRVAKECDVPVSTLFYKVKTDSRYGRETQKDMPKEEKEAEPEPDSSEKVELNWKQVLKKVGTVALIGTAAGAGFKGGSYAVERFFGPEGTKKLLYGNEEEQMEAASRFCLSFIYTLRALTGLTDPFGEGIKPAHLTGALAYTLDLDSPEQTLDDQLVDKVARDWQDPGPLDEEIDLGEYRTVPASQISSDWKSKLDQFGEDRDLKVRAYLKHEKGSWAILTSSGKVVGCSPGVATAKEWMKALGLDYPESFG